MTIKPNFEKAINAQIYLEWLASYNYLAMSAWLETTPFKGFAKWMLARSEREQAHAIQLFEYLRNRSGKLKLPLLVEPVKSYDSPLAVFKAALAQKVSLSKTTHEIYAMAVKEKDLETIELLQGFIKEQVKEEKRIQDLLDKVALAGKSADALIHLDYKEELAHAAA